MIDKEPYEVFPEDKTVNKKSEGGPYIFPGSALKIKISQVKMANCQCNNYDRSGVNCPVCGKEFNIINFVIDPELDKLNFKIPKFFQDGGPTPRYININPKGGDNGRNNTDSKNA